VLAGAHLGALPSVGYPWGSSIRRFWRRSLRGVLAQRVLPSVAVAFAASGGVHCGGDAFEGQRLRMT